VAPLGWSAFWRRRCRLMSIDLPSSVTSCQSIDFGQLGPTISIATVIPAFQSNKVYLPPTASGRAGVFGMADRRSSLAILNHDP